MVLWRKRTRPITRGVHSLEFPFIRDFTTFVSFPLSRALTGYQCSFSRSTLLVFVVPKIVFCLSDIVHSDGNGTGEISNYFAYQRAKLFAGDKITYTNSLYLQNYLPRSMRYEEKLLSLSVNKFMFFYFLLELRIACQLII